MCCKYACIELKILTLLLRDLWSISTLKLQGQIKYKENIKYYLYIANILGRPGDLELANRHIHRFCTDKTCPVFPSECGFIYRKFK